MPHLVVTALFLFALILVAAGYFLGTRRGQKRERALRTTIGEQSEKLSRVEGELLFRSSLDPVTELPIQQALQDFLEQEWRREARDRKPLSLIMVEVDHFRPFNERMGKPEGDACLKRVAQCLRQVGHRPADFLASYGAGRFGLVLGGTDGDGALVLGEKLRQLVESLTFPNPASITGTIITVSIGVAAVTPNRDLAWQDIELIAAAERALAQARESGRNRVALEPIASQPVQTR
jgi:diguanylate cyclase (GGDEF)-like protein